VCRAPFHLPSRVCLFWRTRYGFLVPRATASPVRSEQRDLVVRWCRLPAWTVRPQIFTRPRSGGGPTTIPLRHQNGGENLHARQRHSGQNGGGSSFGWAGSGWGSAHNRPPQPERRRVPSSTRRSEWWWFVVGVGLFGLGFGRCRCRCRLWLGDGFGFAGVLVPVGGGPDVDAVDVVESPSAFVFEPVVVSALCRPPDYAAWASVCVGLQGFRRGERGIIRLL
jgi:hypothetical protein